MDWPRTRAWGEGGYYARVCLNVKGREPEGAVEPADYERTRSELAARLAQIPDDRGLPMATVAHKAEEIYRRVDGIAPDLIVIFGDLHWRAVGTLGYDSLYTSENDTGPDEANHAQYGFFNWISPSIAPAEKAVDIDILEIAPTMLSHFAIAPPAPMQGRIVPL